jgi:RNA polymerase sigma-70 factor (ECF subfamily)
MVAAPDNEARLVELAVAGDFNSFAALYTCYLDSIYRYIFYRNGDTEDAEDLTEQVFLKAWEALPNYKPVGSSFINWLYRIAHNIVVDHHRRSKLIQFEGLREDAFMMGQSHETTLDIVISKEEAEALAAGIAKLPEEYQQIIILRFIEGFGHAEIAQIVDKSEVACRGIQHRALAFSTKSYRIRPGESNVKKPESDRHHFGTLPGRDTIRAETKTARPYPEQRTELESLLGLAVQLRRRNMKLTPASGRDTCLRSMVATTTRHAGAQVFHFIFCPNCAVNSPPNNPVHLRLALYGRRIMVVLIVACGVLTRFSSAARFFIRKRSRASPTHSL